MELNLILYYVYVQVKFTDSELCISECHNVTMLKM